MYGYNRALIMEPVDRFVGFPSKKARMSLIVLKLNIHGNKDVLVYANIYFL